MIAPELKIVIVGARESPSVETLATALRRRGFAVLVLESISLAGLLMATNRVLSVVVFETELSTDWRMTRSRLAEIGPQTPTLFVSADDRRTPDELACEITCPYEE